MQRLRAFIALSRLKFLLGGFLGVALGAAATAAEHRSLGAGAYLHAQWLVTSFHLMTHYSNEYFDLEADRAAVRTPFSGGSGVLVRGLLAPTVALRAALVCAISGTSAVFAFTAEGNPAAALAGIAIGILAWSYSAPPMRLLARGLGELATSLVVGSLVPLASFAAQTRMIDTFAVTATVPPALAMFVMMLAVEVPDIAADSAGGKRNLVVRFGTRLVPGLASLEHRAAARVAFLGVACFVATTLATILMLLRT